MRTKKELRNNCPTRSDARQVSENGEIRNNIWKSFPNNNNNNNLSTSRTAKRQGMLAVKKYTFSHLPNIINLPLFMNVFMNSVSISKVLEKNGKSDQNFSFRKEEKF